MKELENRIGYHFQNPKLLQTALTHPSYGREHHVPHYQRMEFLGDAVLELAVSRYLFFELPEIDEGKLTRIRAALVREEALFKAAQRIGLGEYLYLSVGEEKTGGRKKPSILADVMEAVLAAVYLDGGFDAAVKLIEIVLGDELRPEVLEDHLDAKSKLQEVMQRSGRMPVYELLGVEGPPHAPIFSYRVMDGDFEMGVGKGSSKQNAQQMAAREALNRMGAKA